MNSLEREEQRKLHERRDDDLKLPEYPNRAHRACERECLDLKDHIKALESLLARYGEVLYDFPRSENDAIDRICAEIDAILPATEVDNG